MKYVLTFVAAVVATTAASSHDLFLVLPSHSYPAGSQITVALYNGSFDRSENTIDRERMVDVSVIDGAGRTSHPEADQWREEGTVTFLDFQSGAPGTCVVGVSTAPRMIELSAADFNDYLEHDGVLDVLDARHSAGIADQPAAERYSKHVKTIFQVGDAPTGSYAHRFGYPIEIVPLANPASLGAGDIFEALVLADGDPVAGQLVYASYEGYHGHDDEGSHREAAHVRTDERGVARFQLTRSGRWYVRLIRMLPSVEEGVDYESAWATLTFEID